MFDEVFTYLDGPLHRRGVDHGQPGLFRVLGGVNDTCDAGDGAVKLGRPISHPRQIPARTASGFYLSPEGEPFVMRQRGENQPLHFFRAA
jgi:hypothetical protein